MGMLLLGVGLIEGAGFYAKFNEPRLAREAAIARAVDPQNLPPEHKTIVGTMGAGASLALAGVFTGLRAMREPAPRKREVHFLRGLE